MFQNLHKKTVEILANKAENYLFERPDSSESNIFNGKFWISRINTLLCDCQIFSRTIDDKQAIPDILKLKRLPKPVNRHSKTGMLNFQCRKKVIVRSNNQVLH